MQKGRGSGLAPTRDAGSGLANLARMRRALRTAAHVAGAARVFSDLGARTAAAVALSTIETATADRRRRRERAVPRDPGPLVDAHPVLEERVDRAGRRRRVAVGVACRFPRAELEVRFLADDLLRISWGPDDPPVSWALAGDPLVERPGPLGAVQVAVGASGAAAVSAAVGVRVGTDGSIRLHGPGGDLLRHELPPIRAGARRTHRHLLREGERLVGLGEQAGSLFLGGLHRLWNRDPGGGWGPGAGPLYCVVPVVIGLHPAGNLLDFFENPAEGEVEVVTGGAASVTGSCRMEARFSSGMLRHYVAVGSLSSVLERYGALTGRPPLPPRWALGYHQSRWGYASEAEVRAVANGFRDERLPLSAIHLDIDYMDGYRVFTVDNERFPDLAVLTAELARQGTRVVTILDPGVKADPAYDVYVSGAGHFVRGDDGGVLHGVVWPGRAAFPDFTDEGASRWWGGFYRRLVDAGVAGVWHDMNEPTSLSLWGDQTLPRDARHAAGDHRSCHNVYGLLMAEAGAAALGEARPDRRPFVLSRSGWAGLQRRSWIWTGDAETSWESLRQQVSTVIGLGLSGIPFAGPDIGGFTGTPTEELYVRWLELAVFLPFCRTHCTHSAAPREPWSFPEPARSRIGALIRLRYRLLPYLYTLAEEASRTGNPLVRPLGWPATVDVRGSADELLLGNDLLVTPVTVEGARSRRVTLPAGDWARWMALAAGGDRVGPPLRESTVVVDAPLGAPPVFVRAGTVLPLDDAPFDDAPYGHAPYDDAPHGDARLGHAPRLVSLHCVPDRSGRARGRLYDDAGDGYGDHRHHRFTLTSGAGGLRTLRWEREGDYPDPPRVRVVLHGKAAAGVRADGTDVPYGVRRPPRAGSGPAAGGAGGPEAGGTGGAEAGGAVATVVDCPPFEVMELL